MLLEKLYTEFVNHTDLTDAVYRTVFANISDVLEKIKNVSWTYLKYTDQNGESITFDFTKDTSIPRYGIDLFRNTFLNYYILPENSAVTLGLNYKDTPYVITDTAEGLDIPEPVAFLHDLGLFSMFLIDREVYDLFGAFDSEFEFIDSFRNTSKSVYAPLIKKFESSTAQEQVVEGNVSTNQVAEVQLSVELLQNKMQEMLGEIDSIRKTRDALTLQRNTLFARLSSKDAMLLERDKLQIELDTLVGTRDAYQVRCVELAQLLQDINAELFDLDAKKSSDSSLSEEDVDSWQYLVDKKGLFLRDKESLDKSVDDFNTFIADLSNRVKGLNEELLQITDHTTNDVTSIDTQINELNEKQDDLYGILLGLEAELKQRKGILETSAVQVERAHAYSDMTVQGIENMSIATHLATPQQPASVTTVVNYLRYYFSYHATEFVQGLKNQYPQLDIYVLQAMACKIALARYFNITFNQIFSPVAFSDSKIGKVILITKE